MTQRFNLDALLILFISGISLGLGILMQSSPPSQILIWAGFAITWLICSFIFSFSLKTNLVFISLFFLRPYTLVFFAVLILLIFGWIIENYKQSSRLAILPFPLFFIVLLGFGIYALTKTYVSGGSVYFAATVIVPLVSFLLISNIQQIEEDLRVWTKSIAIIAFILAVYGVFVALMNPAERIGSTWSNAMTINGFYTVGFFFALANAAKTEYRHYKMLWIGFAFIIFLGMVYTYTRIALVAVLFGLFIMILRLKKIRLYAITALALMTLFIPSSMAERISMGMEIDLSIIIRLIVWTKAIGMVLSHPFTGIGFSTWKDIYHGMVPSELLYAQHAHNLIINLALEMGIIAAFAFLAIIIITLRRYYKLVVKTADNSFHFIVMIAMLSLLVACLTDIFIQQYQISILFWITLALLFRETKHHRTETAS